MTSKTGKNRKAGTFEKGDPRINRKGRPKTFDALRKLAIEIANEPQESGRSRIEEILKSWATSNDPRVQGQFVEVAYGKPPAELKVDTPTKHEIVIRYADRVIATAPPTLADEDRPGSEEI